MTKLYKLTTQDNKTRPGYSNECVWGEGVTHSGTGEGDLCGPGYIHAYTDPLLAVLLNPIHANYADPKLWIAEGDIAIDQSDKIGCNSLTTIKEIDLPVITNEQRCIFAILCVKEIGVDIPAWNSWADDYLSGKDRTAWAAEAAARAAEAAAWAAAWADAAARAARAAAWAVARAAEAVWAAEAAWAVARTANNIDLAAIAHKAMEYK